MTPTFARDAIAPVFSNVLRSKVPLSRLYPILDAGPSGYETKTSFCDAIASLGKAGCRLVQLRAKELSAGDFLAWAKAGVAAARRHDVALIVNDRADVALLSGASGVHVGQDDISVSSVRRVLGNEAIIGLSTHSLEQAKDAEAEAVDYVAIGPVYATKTKSEAPAFAGQAPAFAGQAPAYARPLGLSAVREVRRAVQKPLVAIGGITIERARELFQVGVGVDGVAVISGLRKSDISLEEQARRWLAIEEDEEFS